ncbi:Hint domain-containing protein [Ascidiaceihabitans sp.]|uniref:Hint domain-containing protein n=1 Tax=Ascidiaceihabitans sp. TaxID=1872644 RepID=UPI0032999043
MSSGGMAMTRDFGQQPVLCATQTSVLTKGASRAVQFAPGAWGNKDTIVLSQNPRVVLAGAQAQLLYGTEDVSIPAAALLGRPGISLGSSGSIMSYYHFVLPQHSVVFSGSLLSESFYPTCRNLLHIGDHARQVILSSMVKHGLDPDTYGDTVRRTAKTYEVFCLAG